MTRRFRAAILASLSISVLTLTACGTTGSAPNANVTNKADASRVDAILEKAARDARASGNKAETVVLFEEIYQRNQKDAAIATGFGQALREDEQLNRARQVLLPFTEGENPYPDAVMELAMVQLGLGQYKEAELTARKAVELDPKSGRAYLALGTALDAQNYHEQAEVAFRRGLDNWKGDPAPILNNLALNLASQNKLDQAIDMLKKAKEISPGRMEIERNLRIITTLKEGADDFLIKKQQGTQKTTAPVTTPVKKAESALATAPAPASAPKKEAVQKKDEPKSREDIDNKQLEKPAPAKAKKTETKKPVAKKDAKEPVSKSAPSENKQNFNRNE